MKLDELLKNPQKPIKDDGFTDRVMRTLEIEATPIAKISPATTWLARLDLSGMEALLAAFAILGAIYVFPLFHLDPNLIFMLGGSLLVVYGFTEEPLFE
jgi:hypothetical protein